MSKTLTNQINRAIAEHMATGHSRRAERAGGVDTSLRIYSTGRDGKGGQYQKMRDASRQLGTWMKERHPEVRWARDIRPEHIAEYMTEKAQSSWSDATFKSMRSVYEKLGRLVHDTYGGSRASWTATTAKAVPITAAEKLRTYAFSEKERRALREEAEHCRSEALKAGAWASYYGLRVGSIPEVRIRDIYEDHLHIERDKGGRSRDIYFTSAAQRDQARRALQWAVDHGRTGRDAKVWDIRPGSIGKAIQRTCGKLGYSFASNGRTSEHALRKSYARERYEQEYSARHCGESPYFDAVTREARHWGDDRVPSILERVRYDAEAWDVVSQELGHGRHRTDLFTAYISRYC